MRKKKKKKKKKHKKHKKEKRKKKKKNMQVTVTHNPKGMQKQITRPNRKKIILTKKKIDEDFKIKNDTLLYIDQESRLCT